MPVKGVDMAEERVIGEIVEDNIRGAIVLRKSDTGYCRISSYILYIASLV